MNGVAVETVGDEAAAAVLAEALAAHDIAVTLRRVPSSPYGPSKLEIEVRVAPEELTRARAVLAHLSEEAEAAARAEAQQAPAPEPATVPSGRFGIKRLTGTRLMLAAALLLLTELLAHILMTRHRG